MNLIGEDVRLVSSRDPGKKGLVGRVVLETAKTLLLDSQGRNVRVEKAGSAFLMLSSGEILSGTDLAGRLEDRWGGRR